MSLFSKAESFLKASGYNVSPLDEKDFLKAEMPGLVDDICIGIVEEAPEASAQHQIEERFNRVASGNSDATLIFLRTGTERYQADTLNYLRKLKVKILQPAFFFDNLFTWDTHRSAASAALGLAESGESHEPLRVKQPFVIPAFNKQGDDLAEYLLNEVRAQSRSYSRSPTLWIVSAPAGYGKSIMFASLFHKVYDEFHKQKRSLISFPRPLPMIAEHLRAAPGPNIKGLISGFMKTEFAGNVPDEVFPWMIDNGHGFWMTDGLDEVITSDDEFMDFLLDRFTQPSQPSSSPPLMLMSLRDSLLESREQLHELIGTEGVHLINLLPWERPQKRSFAWTKVHKRLPRETNSDDPEVKDLVKVLTKDEHDGLSSTPFYADMLADEFLAGASLASRNESDLLDSAVSAMCRREYAKNGPIQETVLPIENFRDWLEEVAGEVVRKSGISIDDLEILSELVLALITEDITQAEARDLVNQMTVMPFLKTNPVSGKFEFTHEILGEFLAGSFYAKQMQIDAGRDWGKMYLGQQALQGDSMLLKVIAWNFREKRDELVKAIRKCPSSTIPGKVHRNIVQLFALMDNGRELLDKSLLSLERADLSGVQFGSMDLQKVSFVGSDLSFTDLSECNLQRAIFESARLHDTSLPSISSKKLENAIFDKIKNFESIRHGASRHGAGSSISSYGDFLDWAEKATNVKMKRDLPCPSACQLADLFGRFFHPSGEARRNSSVRDRRLLQGGPTIRDTVDKVCKFGYLTRDHSPSGASRPTAHDDRYREIVDFMRDSVLSPGLSDLLADLCRKTDCRHTAP